jgi:hypothetical protein
MPTDQEFINRSTQEALRIEEDCSYNATGHFVAAKRWRIANYSLAFPATLLAALVSYLAFTAQGVLAGAIGVIITILTTATLFLRPDHLGSEHQRVAEKYLGLRNKVRLFREIELLHSGRSKHELLQTLGQLSDKKNELNADSFPLPDWAYRRAKQRLGEGSHAYDADRAMPKIGSPTIEADQKKLTSGSDAHDVEQKKLTN